MSSSMRASDRKGWRFVGQHSGQQHTGDKPFEVRHWAPDPAIRKAREHINRALEERRQFWTEELATILAEFGPEVAARLQQSVLGR